MKDKKRLLKKLGIIPVIIILYLVMRILKTTCIIKCLTGYRCLGCGLTRAIISAIRLDFKGAFQYHFMFWSVPIIFGYYFKDLQLFKSKIANVVVASIIVAGFVFNHIFNSYIE